MNVYNHSEDPYHQAREGFKNFGLLTVRDMLIWQIKEYLYPTSILGMIYHIRADAFIFFGL